MLLLNTLLALAWVVLTSQYSALNFFAGFVIGYLVLLPAQRLRPESRYFAKVPQVLQFVAFFIWALIVANIRVLISVLGPHRNLRPAIVAVPLDVQSDTEITLLANLITLTPGTLSLDVSTDRRVLFVHVIHVEDVERFIYEIKDGFERRVREVLA